MQGGMQRFGSISADKPLGSIGGCSVQGPAAQEPHTAQAIESGASFMAAVTDATAPMPGMAGDPSQPQQVQGVQGG